MENNNQIDISNKIKLEEIIKELENIDYESSTVDDIKSIINPIIRQLKTFKSPLIEEGVSLFRTRILSENEKPKSISNISYPPKEFVTSFQRVNIPNSPVFYCSFLKDVAIKEVNPKIGDNIVLSEWETTRKLIITNIGFAPKFIKTLNAKRDIQWQKSKIENEIKLPPNENAINNLILEFLSEIFCKQIQKDRASEYKLSIAISELVGFFPKSTKEPYKFGNNTRIEEAFDGILYPSIPEKASADNLAIRPYSVEKKIKFLCADWCRIDDIVIENNQKKIKLFEIDYANSIDENNNIIWKGRKGKFQTRFKGDALQVKKTRENEFEVSYLNGDKMIR